MGKTQGDCQPLSHAIIGRLRAPSAAPRDYARDNFSEFLVDLSGVELPPFGRPPSSNELLNKITEQEIDALFGSVKKSSRKGLVAEKRHLHKVLIEQAQERAAQLAAMPKAERPTTLFGRDKIAADAMASDAPGPVAAGLWGEIAAKPGLVGVDSPEMLALLLTRPEALERKLARAGREELITIKSWLAGSRRRDGSKTAGFFRSQHGKSTLIHLISPGTVRRWSNITACGKSGAYPANHGAWNDAEYGGEYRRCRQCEKDVSTASKAEAEAERSDVIDGEQIEFRSIPEIRDALLLASQDQKAFDLLKLGPFPNNRTPYSNIDSNGLREIIGRNLTDVIDRQVEKETMESLIKGHIVHKTWRELDERNVFAGPNSKERQEIFSPEVKSTLIEKAIAKRKHFLHYDSAATRAAEKEISELINDEVNKFLETSPDS